MIFNLSYACSCDTYVCTCVAMYLPTYVLSIVSTLSLHQMLNVDSLVNKIVGCQS